MGLDLENNRKMPNTSVLVTFRCNQVSDKTSQGRVCFCSQIQGSVHVAGKRRWGRLRRQLVTWPLLWGGREMNVSTQLLSPFYSDQDLNSWKVKLRVKASLPTSVNPSQPRPGVCLLHDVRSCRVENIRHHHAEWNKGKK